MKSATKHEIEIGQWVEVEYDCYDHSGRTLVATAGTAAEVIGYGRRFHGRDTYRLRFAGGAELVVLAVHPVVYVPRG